MAQEKKSFVVAVSPEIWRSVFLASPLAVLVAR